MYDWKKLYLFKLYNMIFKRVYSLIISYVYTLRSDEQNQVKWYI